MTDSFLTFTESDALNRLSQTAARSTFAAVDRTDDVIYLYKDYGALEFDDFTHEFDFRITAIAVSAATQERIAVITYCKQLNDWNGNLAALKDQLSFIIKSNNVGNQFTLVWEETEGGNEYKDEPGQVYTVGTTYYAKIRKSGTTATIYIYSDAVRATLIDSSVLTLQSDYAFRYLLIPQALDAETSQTCSGYVENLVAVVPSVAVVLTSDEVLHLLKCHAHLPRRIHRDRRLVGIIGILTIHAGPTGNLPTPIRRRH